MGVLLTTWKGSAFVPCSSSSCRSLRGTRATNHRPNPSPSSSSPDSAPRSLPSSQRREHPRHPPNLHAPIDLHDITTELALVPGDLSDAVLLKHSWERHLALPHLTPDVVLAAKLVQEAPAVGIQVLPTSRGASATNSSILTSVSSGLTGHTCA